VVYGGIVLIEASNRRDWRLMVRQSNRKLVQTSLSPEERQATILERINEKGRALSSELAIEFGVSEDSIRRDLRHLTDAKLVQRFHGGAAKKATPSLEFETRLSQNARAKNFIALEAAARVANNTTMLVDSSTTVLSFIRALHPRFEGCIITASPDIAVVALENPSVAVVTIGGVINRANRSAVGASVLASVQSYNADLCVLGACGIDDNLCLRADDLEDALLKREMIRSSSATMVLASADKFGKPAAFFVAPISEISSVIVDQMTDVDVLRRIREQGVSVILASEK